jgi:hypothetical protein
MTRVALGGLAKRRLYALGMAEIVIEPRITCPTCGFTKIETMPTNACQHFYRCAGCGDLLKPLPGDCCVFCSYADSLRPPKQNAA